MTCTPKPSAKQLAAEQAWEADYRCNSTHLTSGEILNWPAEDGVCVWTCMEGKDSRARSGKIVLGNIMFKTLPDGGACPSRWSRILPLPDGIAYFGPS